MSWRVLIALAVTAVAHEVALPRFGWTYRIFRDDFRLWHVGLDVTFTLFIFAVVMMVVNAVAGPSEEP